jgi:pimeloyl-ACP methyl ester carboxylesterase
VGAPTRLPRRAAAVAAFVVIAGSCSQQSAIRSEALASSTAVTFRTGDGVQLAGRLFGPDDAVVGVVFAHMLPADQSAWFDLASDVGAMGYRALTFDFRGYCPGGDAGCSEGTKDVDATPQDLRAALGYLRGRGVDRVALVGASMGGTAALVVAAAEGDAIAAVVTLSAPQQLLGLAAGPDVLQLVTAAKLFIAGNGDPTGSATAAQAFYDSSLQPKRYEIVTSDDHGTDLLSGNQGQQVHDLITAWLSLHLPVATPSPGAGP